MPPKSGYWLISSARVVLLGVHFDSIDKQKMDHWQRHHVLKVTVRYIDISVDTGEREQHTRKYYMR